VGQPAGDQDTVDAGDACPQARICAGGLRAVQDVRCAASGTCGNAGAAEAPKVVGVSKATEALGAAEITETSEAVGTSEARTGEMVVGCAAGGGMAGG
jgi:hypothetical protein